MKQRIQVGYLITGEFMPKTITSLLKISPTTTWEKGDPVQPKSTLRQKQSGWCLEEVFLYDDHEDNTRELENLNSMTLSLFKKLEPDWETLKQLGTKFDCELSCVIYFEEGIPEVHFSVDAVKSIAELNLSIDVDLYDFRE
jgi:hypothetical protein